MKLVFVHGWGFDARVWDAVIACLPNDDIVRLDLGYFGERLWTVVEGPCLAITHSFGTMALLADPPAGCRGLVAINGFDRFTQTTDRPGVPRRLLDRMMARMESDPGAVLGEFHARLGSAVPGGAPHLDPLLRDLTAMRDGDRRTDLADWGRPVVALDGAEDPLLTAPVRQAQFARAAGLECETIAGGGHVLPLTHPRLCAAWIERMRVTA